MPKPDITCVRSKVIVDVTVDCVHPHDPRLWKLYEDLRKAGMNARLVTHCKTTEGTCYSWIDVDHGRLAIADEAEEVIDFHLGDAERLLLIGGQG